MLLTGKELRDAVLPQIFKSSNVVCTHKHLCTVLFLDVAMQRVNKAYGASFIIPPVTTEYSQLNCAHYFLLSECHNI